MSFIQFTVEIIDSLRRLFGARVRLSNPSAFHLQDTTHSHIVNVENSRISEEEQQQHHEYLDGVDSSSPAAAESAESPVAAASSNSRERQVTNGNTG